MALIRTILKFNATIQQTQQNKKRNTVTLERWRREQLFFELLKQSGVTSWDNNEEGRGTAVEGRISGSLAWRLSRNKTRIDNNGGSGSSSSSSKKIDIPDDSDNNKNNEEATATAIIQKNDCLIISEPAAFAIPSVTFVSE